MRRIFLLLAMVAIALVVSLGSLAGQHTEQAQAQAQPDTFNETIPFNTTLTDSCTGEAVTFEGTWHILVHFTQDASGGLHGVAHNNIQGQGVGSSGAKYITTQGSTSTSTISTDTANNFGVTGNARVVRTGVDGTQDDEVFTFRLHVTLTPNGELTAEVMENNVECI
jgi:hypothetical protein